jgi:hypothetical protein
MSKARAVAGDSLYDVHPGVAIVQKWLAELKPRTGRSLEEWIALARREGPKDQKGLREWLQDKHKHGMSSAWWIAERAAGKGHAEDGPESYLKAAALYVDEQYSGGKEKFRPLLDQILKTAKSIASDVKACPCQTIVPLYRNHVFAQIKPTTSTRVDLGFALAKYKGKLHKRLIDTGGMAKKDRITHRIELKSPGEFDDDAKKWLKIAYDLDT